MSSSIIHTRHGVIEYRSVGNGHPIVFVHGGHSNCYETLTHKSFDLSKFRLLTPSRPGYGNTPLAGNQTPSKAAQLIVELMKFLSIEKAIIYGISAGGLTAIKLAEEYPDYVEKLILASAVSKKWLDSKDKIYKTAQIIFHPKIEGVTWGMVRFFSKVFPRIIAKSFFSQFSTFPSQKLGKKDIDELILALKAYRSKRGFLNDLNQNISSESIKKIQAPCLVIHSKYDNSVPLEHAIHAHELINNSTLVELNNEWGHLFWIGRDSEDSLNVINKFINEKEQL
ncbi:alpha/beta fold hydrolase [Flagellimonas meridianipacifica]|uniref:Pimeloyl-ACP methyl ester carboxylesterase n=1 Tax=Flagellimonas meridianipacifica TaxID=1080225 RepID=A0A2T0MI32_9FLAO|nr:alpha/beta hydrolase [Allomuricauda pacifica]PRX57220.1 pimeloyl-ACP methyl ester carboxylesterase [Allomuricauda pacifica]